jgi:hypothetical protein
MHIQLKRPIFLDKTNHDAGDVVEVDARRAKTLITLGVAERCAAPPPPPGPTSRIVLNDPIFVEGLKHRSGDVVEVDQEHARILILHGVAGLAPPDPDSEPDPEKREASAPPRARRATREP